MGALKKEYIGVDLGSSAMDCAILEKKGKLVHLKEYFSIKKESPGEDKANDVLRISNEFKSRKMNNSKAAISIPDKNFLLITFKLPKLPPKEKDIAVRSEIEQKLPFPLEEAAFDVIRLNPKEQSENDYVAFCTRMSDVGRAHGIASNYNLIPERVITETIANMNCAEFNGYLTQADISYLLLDIGATHVGFTLLTNGLPWLSFSLAPRDNFSVDDGGKAYDPVKFVDENLHDIAKIISSFEEKSVIAPVKKILLFGKGELLDQLHEKIAALTPISLERVDPLKNFQVSDKVKERLNPSLISTVAVGLALSGVDGLEAANVKG